MQNQSDAQHSGQQRSTQHILADDDVPLILCIPAPAYTKKQMPSKPLVSFTPATEKERKLVFLRELESWRRQEAEAEAKRKADRYANFVYYHID